MITLIVWCDLLKSQVPSIDWKKCYGGNSTEIAYSINKTNDGGYIIAGGSASSKGGLTENYGGLDYWVVKITANGTIQWQRNYGGSGTDEAYSIQQTYDGGYIVAGTSNSSDSDITNNHGSDDVWVVKMNAYGSIQWQKSYGGSNIDRAYSIYQTTDSGFIVAGYTESNNGDISSNHGLYDSWILKITSNGNLQWQKSYGGTGHDYGYSILQTTDGGYIFSGTTESTDGDVLGNYGWDDMWVVKLSMNGNLQWQKCYGGDFTEYGLTTIIPTYDGGYVVSGSTWSDNFDAISNHGLQDLFLVKINDTGGVKWHRTYGGGNYDFGGSVVQTLDSGYAFVGTSKSYNGQVTGNHGDYDVWLIKANSKGNFQWQKSLGGSNEDDGADILQTSDGGLLILSTTYSTNGDVTDNNGDTDYWVVKLYGTNAITDLNQETISIFPNPTSNLLSISAPKSKSISVTNSLGQVVFTKILLSSVKFELSTANWQSGIYLLRFINEDGSVEFAKLIKE